MTTSDQDGLARSVRQFILDHIESVEQLEVLLLLAREPGRPKNAAVVATELRSSVSSVARRLEDLCRRGLLIASPAESGEVYSFPADSPHAPLVGEVQKAYQERRIRVINLIFSRPIDKLRTFADAFRIKEPK